MNEEIVLKAFENPWVQGILNKIFIKGKEFLKDLNEKEKLQWGTAFEEYLKKTNESFSKTKTLLCPNTPVNIYEFYECISLRKNNEVKDFLEDDFDEEIMLCSEKNRIDTQDITNVLNVSNKVLITGTGGIGKTIMMKHFFLNTIEKTNLIPVLIELRKINKLGETDFNLETYIINFLKEYKLNLEKKYFEYTFNEGYYIFLFDGVDEVEEKLRIKLKTEIDKFTFKYDKNYFIISSRPSSEFISWNNFIELKSLHLTKEQAISLIKKIRYDEVVKNKFAVALENGLFENYYTFASTPLLLNIMLLTFEANATIPNKLNDFYEQAFSVLFYRHDATKDCYVRERKSGLEYVDFKKAFSYFCFKTYFNEKYNFSYKEIIEYINSIDNHKLEIPEFKASYFLYDLMSSLCLIVEEGIDYKFVHRSFQEYFAAVYFKELLDEQQKSFFLLFLEKGSMKFEDKFFKILLGLQKERFIKNIILPYIQKIKESMEKITEYNNDKEKKIILFFIGNFQIEIRRNKSIAFRGGKITYYEGICFLSNILDLDSKVVMHNIVELYKEMEKVVKKVLEKKIYKLLKGQKIKIYLRDFLSNDEIWNLFNKENFQNIFDSWNELENFYEIHNKKQEKELTFDDFFNTL